MLPLAGEQLAYRNGTGASFIISALIILPQIVVALSSPWVGQLAQSWGRRPLLLIGFSALAVRALLFAVTNDPPLLICIQLLDGVSGSALGVLTALIVADLTNGTGADSIWPKALLGRSRALARRSALYSLASLLETSVAQLDFSALPPQH